MLERRAFTMSIALSVLAMYLVWQYVSSQDAEMEDMYGMQTSRVIIRASRDILQYETIRPTDIETIRVPKAMLPPGYIEDPKDVIDAVAAIPISKDEHILDNKIISKNVYSGLDTQIVQGRRARTNPLKIHLGADRRGLSGRAVPAPCRSRRAGRAPHPGVFLRGQLRASAR